MKWDLESMRLCAAAKDVEARAATKEAEARATAKEDFKKWCMLEEMSWRQKSQELWLKEGDRNTNFFHIMANSHRRRNFMGKIKIEDRWVEEESEIRKGIVEAFQSFLTNPSGWHPNFPSVALSDIGSKSATKIEEPFTKEEVFVALSELNEDKAPSPDGFSMAFWQLSWDFLRNEVMGFFREFYEHRKFVRNLNTTFLVLIPKKGDIEDYKDFRPINLVGSLYKLLAKVLASSYR